MVGIFLPRFKFHKEQIISYAYLKTALKFFWQKSHFWRFFIRTSSKNWKKSQGSPLVKNMSIFLKNFFLNGMISLFYPFLLSMKELLLTICGKNQEKKFSQGGTLVIFSIFWWSRKRKTFKNDFFAKKISRQCSDLPKLWFQFGKTEIGTKKFQFFFHFFFKFSIF